MPPKKKAEQEPVDQQYGIASAQRQMVSGQGNWLRINANERARFHCLTSGGDDRFMGTKFHSIGQGAQTRYYVCLRVMTNGEESCEFCDQGHDEMGNRFALWVYVHNILHATDNPDQEGDRWKQQDVEGRTLFREEVKKPILIWLAAGRYQAWFGQFVAMWTKHQDLQNHIYELLRIGEGLETEYELTELKEEPLAKKILEQEEIQNLPSVPEFFRSQLKYGPTAAGAGASMGTDTVLGEDGSGGDEPLPKAEVASEDDGLI